MEIELKEAELYAKYTLVGADYDTDNDYYYYYDQIQDDCSIHGKDWYSCDEMSHGCCEGHTLAQLMWYGSKMQKGLYKCYPDRWVSKKHEIDGEKHWFVTC